METSTSMSAFSLSNLPVEVRLHVYRELLIQPSSFEPMLCSCYAERHQYWKDQGSIHPAILRTCKLAYAEAYPILHRENTFQLSCKYHGHAMHGEGLPNGHFITPQETSASLVSTAVTDVDAEIMSTQSIYPSFIKRVKGAYPNIRQLVIRVAKPTYEPEYSEVTLRWVQLTSQDVKAYSSTVTETMAYKRSLLVTALNHPYGTFGIAWILSNNSEFMEAATESLRAVADIHQDSDDTVIHTVLPTREWSRAEGIIWSIKGIGEVEYHPTLVGHSTYRT